MARNGIVRCVAAVVLSVLSGCGTVRNIDTFSGSIDADPRYRPVPSVYGGVKMDAAAEARIAKRVGEQPMLEIIGMGLLAADLPISVIGDTLTLPYVLYAQAQKQPGLED